jgi:hypothetical protein
MTSMSTNQDGLVVILLLLALKYHLINTTENDMLVHSRYRKKFLKRLNVRYRRLRQRRIPRVALQDPTQSAWRTLLESGNDQAMITLTGLDMETFNWLCSRFEHWYVGHSPFVDPSHCIVPLQRRNKGRPRLISAADCLGLCLAWTRTRGSTVVLQLIFGMTATPVSMYLRFGRRILIQVLQSEPDAAIKIPIRRPLMLHQQYHDAVQCTHYKGTVTHAPCHGPSYALLPILVPGRTSPGNFPTSVCYKPQRQAQPATRIVHDDKRSIISVIATFTQTSKCPSKKPHGLTPPPNIASLA